MEPPEAAPPSDFELEHLVGELFAGRYRVLRLAALGSTLARFDVVDHDTGREVALKVVRPALAAAPSFRDRFDERMRAVAALSHPNIVAVYDWGVAPVGAVSTAYVVAEQLTGGSLRDMFDRARRLTPSQALAVGLEACRALDYAHRRGFVHTEINPSKLVFGDDRRLRVVDFGISRLLGERDWANPEGVATHVAWYSAPEQGQGAMTDGTVDGAADVYALGLVLHEAVTGTLPFKADSTVATLAQRTGRLMPVSADLGPLASVLERAGRPDPTERSTAAEFGKALVAAASKLPRPEPLPLFATGLFDVAPDELRSPDDPTGGVRRKSPGRQADPDAPTEVLVVPVDEPGPIAPAEPAAPAPAPAPELAPESDTVPVVTGADGLDLAAGAVPAADAPGDLVILPLDTGIDAPPSPASAPPTRVTAPTAAVPVVEYRAPRRRFPWKILIGLLVIGALVTLGVLATRLFRTPSYVVPPLVGLQEAEARNLIAPNRWVIEERSERSDEVPEEGAIVRTAPGAGTELAEGEPFLIVVSQGPTLRPLPDSTGKTLDQALIALQEIAMVAEPTETHHEVVPSGTVISWSVPADATLTAGSEVLPGTVVELVVSQGPAPREVPQLVGVAVDGARTAIESRQLVFTAAPEQEFSDDIAAGSVLWQSVEAGQMVERDSEVVVVLSKGPDVVPFPDISGAADYDAAEAILEEAGFTATLTFGDKQGPVQEYTIDGETPEVGQTFKRGTLVEITAFAETADDPTG